MYLRVWFYVYWLEIINSTILANFIIFTFNTYRKHRCPHRPWGILGKGDEPCAVTEYKNEYRAHDGAKREPFKPANEYKPSDLPLQDETTHK
jgi:hypothetical protein